MQKGQSTLEYLITYGWAILILVVVASILWYLGIFNPSRWIGSQSIGFSKFVVNDFTVNSAGKLTLVFASKEDRAIQNVNVTIIYSNDTVRAWNTTGTMSPGREYTLTIANATDAGNVGDSFNLKVRIKYTKNTLPHSDDGTLIGAIEET